jgi:hypothetical protein
MLFDLYPRCKVGADFQQAKYSPLMAAYVSET